MTPTNTSFTHSPTHPTTAPTPLATVPFLEPPNSRLFAPHPWLLAYITHGAADFTARTLSHGKYCGLIPTRSIAESVFIMRTHLLQDLQDKRPDLDATTEALHRAKGNEIPNKTTQAELVTNHLAADAPAAAEGSASRELKAKTEDLARAHAIKLMANGLQLTARKDTKNRGAAPSTPSTLPEPQKTSSTGRRREFSHHPSLKDQVPEGWSIPAINTWLSTFDEAIQESAKEIVRLLQTSKCTQEQLRDPIGCR